MQGGEANAGDSLDRMIWGGMLSGDVRRKDMVAQERVNTATMRKALDIEQWDFPESNFFWCRRGISGRSTKERHNTSRRGFSAEHVLFPLQEMRGNVSFGARRGRGVSAEHLFSAE